MAGTIETNLIKMGLTLPDAPAPAANYVPYVQSGNLVFISGQISRDDNGLITGKLGAGMGLDAGQNAAKTCALALIAQLKSACGGDLDKVTRIVKLTGFVNATPDFTDHPAVINGASDILAGVFGDAGHHARAAVGVSSLPLGVAVEIEGVFEVA